MQLSLKMVALVCLLMMPEIAHAGFLSSGGGPASQVKETNSTASGTGINLTLGTGDQTYYHVTMTAATTFTLQAATYAGQMITIYFCQNGTGGFTPSINNGAVTVTGTPPTFTTLANKCGDVEYVYTSTTAADLVGSAAGPL